MMPTGHAQKLDRATFNRAARRLLNGLADLALLNNDSAFRFPEKTRHNLCCRSFYTCLHLQSDTYTFPGIPKQL